MTDAAHYPALFRVDQRFPSASLEDVSGAVRTEFARVGPLLDARPGQKVAVGVGSRGIHDLKPIVASVLACLRELGLEPFVLPTMGSHGGATAEGQIQVLAELGITQEAMGVPIVSSMDVTPVGELDSGVPVFFSNDALRADHMVAINRVKPHTAFRGEVESGLCKMLVIGFGKQKGASSAHRNGLARTILPAARVILQKMPILCGLAVLENPSGGTSRVKIARPEEFVETDSTFLREAWDLLPRLPVEDLDVLIVERMGKDISGAGMDPNVIGYWRREGGPRKPDYRTLIVLDLTPPSHGNATGIGMADLTTKRVMDQVDVQATYMNALTSGVLRSAKFPVAVETDERALQIALSHVPDPRRVRLARINSTLDLETFWVSEAVLPDLRENPWLTVQETPLPMRFDGEGRIEREA
jgi:hypothetical protein